jgi:hypothetical protein
VDITTYTTYHYLLLTYLLKYSEKNMRFLLLLLLTFGKFILNSDVVIA